MRDSRYSQGAEDWAARLCLTQSSEVGPPISVIRTPMSFMALSHSRSERQQQRAARLQRAPETSGRIGIMAGSRAHW